MAYESIYSSKAFFPKARLNIFSFTFTLITLRDFLQHRRDVGMGILNPFRLTAVIDRNIALLRSTITRRAGRYSSFIVSTDGKTSSHFFHF